MITKLHIENFKSLADFDLPPNGLQLGKFTCLIGLNGSGKSTLLQAFDFLGQLAIGRMGEWLGQRGWKKSELVCNLGKRSLVIDFRMEFHFDESGDVQWKGRFNMTHLRCTNERIEKYGSSTFSVEEKEIKDLSGIINRLRHRSDAVSALLWEGLSTVEQDILTKYRPSEPSPKPAQDIVLHALNKIVVGPSFYENERFKGISLRSGTTELLKKSSRGFELARFNRLLLEDAYPLELSRNQKNGVLLLEVNEGRLTVAKMDQRSPQVIEKPDLAYEGSVLSILQLKDAHSDVSRVKEVLQNLKSLELLSPHLLRKRASGADDIGIGGEKLAPFLDRLTEDSHRQLQDRLHEFYPHTEKWIVKGYRFGWKGLRVWEDYSAGSVVDAAHLNDGMLRVIAILAQAYSRHRVLLFDEIENGVNPELVEKLVKWLIDLSEMGKQVIVTTHSPMILNYIPDEVAREAVILIYKPTHGRTQCVRFFDLPETQVKLRALGPGEVFVDTKLGDLVARLPTNQSKQ